MGPAGAALREQRRRADKKEQELARKIKANEKIVRQLGKQWAAEKGVSLYNQLAKADRVKTSSLAAALTAVLTNNDREG